MVTDPEAIRFVNEFVRPKAEAARALMAEIAAGTTLWYSGMNNKFPNDPTAVDDGRDAEGVSRLTGANIHSFMSTVIAVAAASNSEVVSKPCVRPMSAS